MKYFALLWILISAIACSGADALDGSEGPSNKIEVTGYLDSSKIQTTTTQPLNSSTEVIVTIIGAKLAATPKLELTATNERSAKTASTTVEDDGSFVVALPALLGDAIHLSLEGISTPATVDIETTNQPDFPELAEDGLSSGRSEFDPAYVWVGVELAEPLENGWLEMTNLVTGDYTILEVNDQECSPEEGADEGAMDEEENMEGDSTEEGVDEGEDGENMGDGCEPHENDWMNDLLYIGEIEAEPHHTLLIVYYDAEEIVSRAIELTVP